MPGSLSILIILKHKAVRLYSICPNINRYMNLLKIALAGAIGTTFMTLYSYGVANKKQREYREPVLLNKLVNRAPVNLPKITKNHAVGWLMHYTIGYTFCVGYDYIWRKTSVSPTTKSSLLMGAMSGVMGIMGWKAFFSAHPNPPKTHYKGFYRQLLVAHVIFGFFAKVGYKLPDKIGVS